MHYGSVTCYMNGTAAWALVSAFSFHYSFHSFTIEYTSDFINRNSCLTFTCRFKGRMFWVVLVRHSCSTMTDIGRFVVVTDMIGGSCGITVGVAMIGSFVGVGLMIILLSSLILGNLMLLIGDALMKDGPASDIGDRPLLLKILLYG